MKKQQVHKLNEAIETLFADFPIDQARAQLWELYTGWVMSGRGVGGSREAPGMMLLFYEHVEMLLDATHRGLTAKARGR